MVIFPQLIIQKYLTHWEFHFLVYTLFHLLHLYRNRLSAYLKVWQPFRLVTLYLGNGLHSFYGQNCGIGWNSGQEVACKIRLMWRVCLKRQKRFLSFLYSHPKKLTWHAKISMQKSLCPIKLMALFRGFLFSHFFHSVCVRLPYFILCISSYKRAINTHIVTFIISQYYTLIIIVLSFPFAIISAFQTWNWL